MPIYTVTAPDGQTFDLEGDSPPTEQELESVFASLETPEQEFAEAYTAQAQRTPVQRAIDIASIGPGIVRNLVSQLVSGAKGAEKIGENAVVTAIQNAVTNQLTGSNLPTNPGVIARGDIGQTVLESAGRVGFDIAQIPGQLERAAPGMQESLARILTESPGAFAGPLPATVALGKEALTSRTPTQEELAREFENQLVSQAIEQVREEPLMPEILGTANIPAAEAIPAAAGLVEGATLLPSLVRSAPRVAAQITRGTFPKITARISPTLQESAMSALNLAETEAQAIIPVAVPRILETEGKAIKNLTAEKILPIADRTQTRLYNDTVNALKQAKEGGLTMKGRQAFQDVTEEIRAIPTLTEEQADAVISQYERFSREIDPVEGQKLLKRLNDELKLFYEKEGVSRSAALANPEIAAKVTFRDSLSDQLDDIVKGITGKDQSPYRDIGQIIEFNANLRKRLSGLKESEAARKAPIERGKARIPIGRVQAITQATKDVTAPFVKTSIERLDKQLQRIFKEGPQKIDTVDLTEESRNAILERYAKGRETLTPPLATPEAAPLTLEDQIQEIISQYPPSLQRDPKLARLAAEAELGIR